MPCYLKVLIFVHGVTNCVFLLCGDALCARLYCDVQHILGCIRSLPSDNPSNSGTPNWGQLDEFLVQRFGAEARQ